MTNDEINAAAKRLRTYDASSIVPLHPYRETPFLHALDVEKLAGLAVGHAYGVLKPLEWEDMPTSGPLGGYPINRTAITIIGRYRVCQSGSSLRFYYETPETCKDVVRGPCVEVASIQVAEAKCWEHYAAEVAKAFIPIGGGT